MRIIRIIPSGVMSKWTSDDFDRELINSDQYGDFMERAVHGVGVDGLVKPPMRVEYTLADLDFIPAERVEVRPGVFMQRYNVTPRRS